MSYYELGPQALQGFGASDSFSAGAAWSDCVSGGQGNAAAGKRCGQAVQVALNALGYGPLVVDGQMGGAALLGLVVLAKRRKAAGST